jgi:pimeloyl-ACP methyl ester carboxylesterase
MNSDLIEKTTGYYKAFDGTPIYYESRGKGEPIVFIYGIACLMNHWHHQVEFFSKSHQVILFDIRGHHKSVPVGNAANLKFEHLAFDLQGLIKHLGHDSAHIVGHSFGAPYVFQAYEQFPEIFKSLVLMFGLEFVEPLYHFLKAQHKKSPDLWNMLWKTMIDNPLAFQLAAMAGGFNIKLTQFKDIEMYGRGVSRLDLPVFFELFGEMLKYDGTPVLATIRPPTMIIAGEKDFLTPVNFQKEISDKIFHSEFWVVPYGSHCCQLDFPEFVNLKLREFFAGVTGEPIIAPLLS